MTLNTAKLDKGDDMRFFFRKKDDPYPSRQIAQHVITLSGRDYSEFETNDASIKFWIPESIEEKRFVIP